VFVVVVVVVVLVASGGVVAVAVGRIVVVVVVVVVSVVRIGGRCGEWYRWLDWWENQLLLSWRRPSGGRRHCVALATLCGGVRRNTDETLLSRVVEAVVTVVFGTSTTYLMWPAIVCWLLKRKQVRFVSNAKRTLGRVVDRELAGFWVVVRLARRLRYTNRWQHTHFGLARRTWAAMLVTTITTTKRAVVRARCPHNLHWKWRQEDAKCEWVAVVTTY
jgi:hypothetical protein